MENVLEIGTADVAMSEDILAERIQTLGNRKLISESEKASIMLKDGQRDKMAKIFYLLMTKDDNSAHLILDVIRNESVEELGDDPGNEHASSTSELDSSETPDDNILLESTRNPLKIAGVLHSVFQFMSVKDLKNCRQVSKEWNYAVEPFLRKLSYIAMGYSADKSNFYRTNNNFQYVLKYSLTEIPFSALRLKEFSRYSDPWPLDDINEIFGQWGNDLKWLSIDEIRIAPLGRASISSLKNWPTLTKLSVKSNKKSRLQFSLDKLLHIESLQLYECDLVIPANCRISPVELKLQFCSLTFQDIDETMKIINNFVDFEKVRTFIYIGEKYNVQPLVMWIKLNMSGTFGLDHLLLDKVCIMNWESSNWLIDRLELANTYFSGDSNLTVREMRIERPLINRTTHIPEGVEHLTCASVDTYNYNLVFPESTKKIFIEKGMKGAVINGLKLNIQTLVLKNVPIANFSHSVNKFVAQDYIWLVSSRHPCQLWLPNLLSSFRKIGNKRIAIGRFDWQSNAYNKSRFPLFVDQQSEYYLFQEGKGTAISEEAFNEMMMN